MRLCSTLSRLTVARRSAAFGHQRIWRGCDCRGELLATLHQLDEEEDINKVLKYFSYEHFYVIYCKVRLVLFCDASTAVQVIAKPDVHRTACTHDVTLD